MASFPIFFWTQYKECIKDDHDLAIFEFKKCFAMKVLQKLTKVCSILRSKNLKKKYRS